MNYLSAILMTVAAVETLLRLPFFLRLRAFQKTVQRAFRIVSSKRISDHWKEKILPVYARDMAEHSLMLGAMLLAVAATALAPGYLMFLVGIGADPLLIYSHMDTLLLSLVVAYLYWKQRSGCHACRL